MTYLFWSFAIVWIALFAYVRVLLRRTHALEQEMRRLAAGAPQALEDRASTPDSGARPADPRPVRRDAPTPPHEDLRPAGRPLRP
jgi:CcmD family protein